MNIAFEVFLRNPKLAQNLTFEESILLGELLRMVKTKLQPLAAEIDQEETLAEAATIIHQEDDGFKLSFYNYSPQLQEKMVTCFSLEDFRQVQREAMRKIVELEN